MEIVIKTVSSRKTILCCSSFQKKGKERKGKEIRYKLLSQDLDFLLSVFQEATISTYPFQRVISAPIILSTKFEPTFRSTFFNFFWNCIFSFNQVFQPVYLFKKKYVNLFRREIANLSICITIRN